MSENDPGEVDMDAMFPPASMTQEQWELAFENVKMDTPEQLIAALVALTKGPPGGHDYNTSGVSMSIAAQLAFNYIAREVGASGFQAGYAALHAYGKITHIDGPFAMFKADDLMYPQHDASARLNEWIDSCAEWLRDEAQTKLDTADPDHVHPDVWSHWEKLADRPDDER